MLTPRYTQVVQAVGLESDFSQMAQGDLTSVLQGTTLSGGQKQVILHYTCLTCQRVSLARALYSDRDILLLDDPYSALDSTVVRHILYHIPELLKDKIVITLTNTPKRISYSTRILKISNGKITKEIPFLKKAHRSTVIVSPRVATVLPTQQESVSSLK